MRHRCTSKSVREAGGGGGGGVILLTVRLKRCVEVSLRWVGRPIVSLVQSTTQPSSGGRFLVVNCR